MKLLVSWLADYIDLTGIKIPELAEKLVHIGFEVEDIFAPENDKNDFVLDISVTANRPDCQSVYGMAREIGAILSRKVKPLDLKYKVKKVASPLPRLQGGLFCTTNIAVDDDSYGIKNNDNSAILPIEISAPKQCSRYLGRLIENVKIKPSPDIIQKRLISLGHKPINNVVDITNYVLIETGQPLHAFDMQMVTEKIIVRNAKKSEKIKLLDGKEYTLEDDMLVIADAQKALALAGIMGGEESSVTHNTKSIFLESARFARGSVRSTSRALGLKSDSSARFEKGVDWQSVDIGSERALALMSKYGVGEIADIKSEAYEAQPTNQILKTSAKEICNILGIDIPESTIKKILTTLNFAVTKSSKELLVKVPLYREDIEGMPDLAEEVIRFYGYDKIVSSMPQTKQIAPGGYTIQDQNILNLKTVLTSLGAQEIVSYAFIPESQLNKLNIASSDKLRNQIKVLNPLSEDFAVMRTQLVGNMLQVVRTNISRKNDSFRLFEVGRAYHAKKIPLSELPQEQETLCLAFYGKDEDFYSIKSVVMEILKKFRIDCNTEYATVPWLHPGMGAKITTAKGIYLGEFGKIHPSVAKNFELPKAVYIAQIDIEPLISNIMSDIKYKIAPKYPIVERDLALVVKDEILVGNLFDCIKTIAGTLCEHIELFDIYKGEQIQEGYKSVALSLRLRAPDRTLTESEIEPLMQQIIKTLKAQFSAELRS